MPKRLTLDEWIDKARSVHGDKYDYSKVVYVNKETPVEIICPVHGSFMQIPNNHIRGKGCAKCKPNCRMSQQDFVKKACKVHHNKYDYSETVFTKTSDNVIIRCPEHGYFTQLAGSHLQGHGCPKCGYLYQFENESDKKLSYEKRVALSQNTCLNKYGVRNPMQVEDFKQRMVSTIVDKYGVSNVAELDSVKFKRKLTNESRYGSVSYLGSSLGQQHMKNVMLDKYGVENYAKSEDFRDAKDDRLQKYRATQLARYGTEHYCQSDDYKSHLSEYKKKEYDTKHRNNSFNTSSHEISVRLSLIGVFGEDDIVCQYHDMRYPFLCDFYIKSRDLFIELNVIWTHGGHWYGIDESDDDVLRKWHTKDSKYYENAIVTWTKRDVFKRSVARKNNLNYVVFWKDDLSDFNEWLDAGCPDGKDWEHEYSWKV